MKGKARLLSSLLAAAVLMTGATACVSRTGEEKPSDLREESSSAVKEPENEEAAAEMTGKIPTVKEGDAVFYQRAFHADFYYPLERGGAEAFTVENLNDWLGGPGTDPLYAIQKVTVEGNTASVELEAAKNDSYDEVLRFLDSVAMTLSQNCGVETVRFLQNGAPAKLILTEGSYTEEGAYIPPEPTELENGVYAPSPLTLPPLTKSEIAEIRAQVPYGIASDSIVPDSVSALVPDTEGAGSYLYELTQYNIPMDDFNSLEEAPGDFLRMAALLNTPITDWSGNDTEYKNLLSPLTPIVDDNTGWMREHVEQTAKKLFGEDVPLVHGAQGIGPWKYWEYAGIYTPPHMGGGYPDLVLLDTNTQENMVEATVVFTWNGSVIGPARGRLEEEEDWASFVRNREQRHLFTMEKTPEGLQLRGHKLLDDEAAMVKRNPEAAAGGMLYAGLTQFDWNGPETLSPDNLVRYYLSLPFAQYSYSEKKELVIPARPLEETVSSLLETETGILRSSGFYQPDKTAEGTLEKGAYVIPSGAWRDPEGKTLWYTFGEVTGQGDILDLPVTVYTDKAKQTLLSDGVLKVRVRKKDNLYPVICEGYQSADSNSAQN